MKQASRYWTRASFAFLAFVFLGYVVKFYPEQLVGFDSSIQETVRGNLSPALTQFFNHLTIIGNPEVQIGLVVVTVLVLFGVKWKAEALWLAVNGSLAGLLIVGLKAIYVRPRPSLTHLVEAGGFSFPSGHSLGSMLIFGTILVIICQRVKKAPVRWALLAILSLLIGLIGLSRIYLGVHYPTDVLAGFVLGFGILNLGFPSYDKKRFEWRFQSKQR